MQRKVARCLNIRQSNECINSVMVLEGFHVKFTLPNTECRVQPRVALVLSIEFHTVNHNPLLRLLRVKHFAVASRIKADDCSLSKQMRHAGQKMKRDSAHY